VTSYVLDVDYNATAGQWG